MRREHIDTESQEFIYAGTLQVRSERLRIDGRGRMVEEPDLLATFSDLVFAMMDAAKSKLRFDEIRVIEGAYIVDMYCTAGLVLEGGEVSAFLERLNGDVERLEANSKLQEPASAADCGVGSSSLGIIETALALDATGHAVNVILSCGREVSMTAPSQDALTALPPKSKKPRKVDGQITGMGWGDDRGCRIEVERGSMYVVAGLTYTQAIDLVKNKTHVSGIATWDGDLYTLKDPLLEGPLPFVRDSY